MEQRSGYLYAVTCQYEGNSSQGILTGLIYVVAKSKTAARNKVAKLWNVDVVKVDLYPLEGQMSFVGIRVHY